MSRLSATGIRGTLAKGRYGDGDGLFLEVGPTGSKSWIVRVQKSGRRRDIGLGSASKVSLADARARAAKVRSLVEAGIDPVAERKKADGVPTFRSASSQVFAENKKSWKNGQHQWQWMRTLEMFAFPAIGDIAVTDVTAAMIRDLLAPIWLSKGETARRVLQRIGVVLDWAHAKGWREADAPIRSVTKGLPRQVRTVKHHAALPHADLPIFLDRLRAAKQTTGRLALEALILTAVRSGEVRGAEWSEIDFDSATWTIPASRMKGGKIHKVPLSSQAIAVLKKAESLRTDQTKLVFPGVQLIRPLSDMTLVKVVRDMGEEVTPHGFRSSFRDWAADETTFPSEVAEAALSHTVSNKVVAAYRRTDFFAKRRSLMDAWGSYCDGDRTSILRLVS